MKSSFTGFLAALAPLAACMLFAGCCCDTSSRCCDPGSGCVAGAVGGGGAVGDDASIRSIRPQTAFQRLVVTNKHTKPVTVTPIGYTTDAGGNRVPVPFEAERSINPAPNVVEPGQTQTFVATQWNLGSIEVTYQEATDPSPFTEVIDSRVNVIRRCIVQYDPAPMDTYLIAEVCPP